jgi:hypothetical protein
VQINDNFAKLSEVRFRRSICGRCAKDKAIHCGISLAFRRTTSDVPSCSDCLQALYLAEQKAREAVETRARIQHELLHNQKERKEDELRKLAQQARFERVSAPAALASTDLKQGRFHVLIPFPSNSHVFQLAAFLPYSFKHIPMTSFKTIIPRTLRL